MPEDRLDLAQYVEPGKTCVCFSLRKSARVVTKVYDDALRPTGLRITQFSLLIVTRLAGTITVNDLAEAMVMDRTTLTRNVKPLANQGLIRVVPGRDRREREVSLTTQGQAALARALPLWRNAQRLVSRKLGQARMARLLRELAVTVEAGRGA